jgi:hypothetical protein
LRGSSTGLRARRQPARVGLRGAQLGVVAAAVAIAAAAVPAAGTAKPPDTGGLLPPGQAKKILDSVRQVAQETTQGVGQAPAVTAPPAAEPGKKPKPDKPPQAGGPKRSQPPAAAPSQSPPAPVVTAPAAPDVSSAPAAAPSAQRPETGARPRRRSTGQDRSGGSARRQPGRGDAAAEPGEADGGAVGGLDRTAPAPRAASDGRRDGERRARSDGPPSPDASPVVRTVRDIIETVPGWMKLALAALAASSLLLAGGYAVTALRARSLARQRRELLGEVGLLQRALLPAIPDDLGGLRTSVAYRPADGPAAGGDFYDVLPLPGQRVGFILGDVSGHGREALERTAFMRYTLRAYLEAGLEPRVALQVAGRVVGDGLGGDFATVLLAVHDPGDGSLTYAAAGHPAPILVHGDPFEPVIAGSSPPIGIGEPTGLRQTTVPLPPGTLACLYTDGLIEARTADGLLGRQRLERMVAELGEGATATDLLEHVATEAVAVRDDMAACLLSPTASVTSGGFRTEQLELSPDELAGPLPARFLIECGVERDARAGALAEAREASERFGGAVISVALGRRRTVEVLPRNLESIEAASLARAAGTGRASSAA